MSLEAIQIDYKIILLECLSEKKKKERKIKQIFTIIMII